MNNRAALAVPQAAQGDFEGRLAPPCWAFPKIHQLPGIRPRMDLK